MLIEDQKIDLFVASKIGSFKHIKYHTNPSKNTKKCIENLVEIKSLQKDEGVNCMVWADDDETEVMLGKNNNQIQIYNTQKDNFTKTYTADFGTGHIVGLGKCERKLLAAKSCGTVRIWSKKSETLVDTGGKLDRMRLCPTDHTLFATGGEENDLKIFRLGEATPYFSAKNIENDWLQLRVPVWVSDIAWLREDLVAVSSRYSYVRLYDTRAQRRPVKNVTFENMAATCIAPSFDELQVLVGFGRGQLHQVDLRNSRKDKGYKGSAGSLTSVSAVSVGETRLVVSAGLDRTLRIHDYQSKALKYKQYLTSKLSCLLAQTKSSTALRKSGEETEVKEEEEGDVEIKEEVDVDEMDELFDNMETVGDRKKPAISEPATKRPRPSGEGTTSTELNAEDAIAKLLRSTERQKKKREKQKREKKQKSVFHNA